MNTNDGDQEKDTHWYHGITEKHFDIAIEKAKREAKEKAMAEILNGCPSDGSDLELILRRAWDRVRCNL